MHANDVHSHAQRKCIRMKITPWFSPTSPLPLILYYPANSAEAGKVWPSTGFTPSRPTKSWNDVVRWKLFELWTCPWINAERSNRYIGTKATQSIPHLFRVKVSFESQWHNYIQCSLRQTPSNPQGDHIDDYIEVRIFLFFEGIIRLSLPCARSFI